MLQSLADFLCVFQGKFLNFFHNSQPRTQWNSEALKSFFCHVGHLQNANLFGFKVVYKSLLEHEVRT